MGNWKSSKIKKNSNGQEDISNYVESYHSINNYAAIGKYNTS